MKILIAIDNSECSMLAIDTVLNNYWPMDSEFEVMTVVEPISCGYALDPCYLDSIYVAEQDLNREAQTFVDSKINLLAEKFPLSRVTGAVYRGPIADVILDRAKASNYDLLVVGSHNRKGINKFFLGSVAEKVAAHAPCSVEIVRAKAQPTKEGKVKDLATASGKRVR